MRFCCYILFFFSCSFFVQKQIYAQEAQRPNIKIGDSCSYVKKVQGREFQPTTHKVVKIEEEEITTEISLPNGIVIENWISTLDGNPKRRESRLGKSNWDPFQPYFSWPLRVGRTWQGEYRYTPHGGGSGLLKISAQVLAYEKVKVTAGIFDAFKINLSGQYQENTPHGNGSGTRNEIIWYSPETQCFIKSVLNAVRWNGNEIPEETKELVSFYRRMQ